MIHNSSSHLHLANNLAHATTAAALTSAKEFTVYPKKYAHGFVVLCFVVVMQSFTMNSHEVFIHIHQGCFAGTGAIVRLPQCQWSKPDGYGKISQCITTTKHSKAKTVCIFLGIYCSYDFNTLLILNFQRIWITMHFTLIAWTNVLQYKRPDNDNVRIPGCLMKRCTVLTKTMPLALLKYLDP